MTQTAVDAPAAARRQPVAVDHRNGFMVAGFLVTMGAAGNRIGAALMPSVLGLVSTMFRQPGQRATAISCWAACLLAGTAIGPVVGGVPLRFFW